MKSLLWVETLSQAYRQMKAFRTISTLSIFNNREIFFHKRIISLKVNKIDNTPPKIVNPRLWN